MRALSILGPLTLVAGVSACDTKPATVDKDAATVFASGVIASPSVRPSASNAPAPSASAVTKSAPRKPRSPKSFDQLKADLNKKCPGKMDGNTVEMRAEFDKIVACMHRAMIADLDAVLLPMKTSNPTQFKALMAEQADWNRYLESACLIEEERYFVDFTTGERNDGSARRFTELGCIQQSTTERVFYAKSLAAKDVKGLSKRIEDKQSDGALVKKIVGEIAVKSSAFAKAPPPKSEDAVVEAEWPQISAAAEAMKTRTVSLAQATCAGVPGLAEALGGKAACEGKAELYYYVQGSSPDMDK